MLDIILLPFKRKPFSWTEWLGSVLFWTSAPLLLIKLLGN